MAKNSLTRYKQRERMGQNEGDTERWIRLIHCWFLFVSLCLCVFVVSLCELLCLCVSAVVSFVPFLSGSFWEEMMRWFLYFANKHSIHLQCSENEIHMRTSWLSILQTNTHALTYNLLDISCAKSCPIMLHAPLFLPVLFFFFFSFFYMDVKLAGKTIKVNENEEGEKNIWKETRLKCELISKITQQ